MKTVNFNASPLACILFTSLLGVVTSCGDINSNSNPNFDNKGNLIPDSLDSKFVLEDPSKVNFFVEVSGSMNGFFRANKSTDFKSDVWNVLSSYSPIASNVNILTNDGSQGEALSLTEFRKKMNTGGFVSTASTRVPTMLETIIENLDTDSNDVAVLVSDMKYSPVGEAAPSVLMGQYRTDISRIMSNFGKSISVICATSDYLDKQGNAMTTRSPYYFVILGNQENVAKVRNDISILLKKQGHLVDNIDGGFDYGHPEYSFGMTNKCIHENMDEPTFVGYEEAEPDDTCTIKLKVPIENYRWIMEDPETFAKAFKSKAIYGSNHSVSIIDIPVKDISGSSKQLKRDAYAELELKIFDMASDSEVIEWTLEMPVTNHELFDEFFIGAYDENDPTTSYSVEDFLRGIFEGGVVTHEMKPNYILVSKNNP